MNLVDHLLIVLLFVVQPIAGWLETRRYAAAASAGRPIDRLGFYRNTVIVEWAFLAVLAAAWWFFERPVEALGFVAPGGARFWVGAVLVAAFAAVLVRSWQAAKTASDAEKGRQLASLGDVLMFVPHTLRELRSFVGVSLTAGIVEEIVYRGFVLWYLAQSMGLWLAVAVSSIAFGLAHTYQGAGGALRCGVVGLAFGVLYVATGSIWLPIVAHVVLDVLQGLMLYEMLRRDSCARRGRQRAGKGFVKRVES